MARKTLTPVPAKAVRSFFAENPTLVPDAALVSLRPGQRGRLHPDAVAVFNERNAEQGVEYVTGNVPGSMVTFTYTQPSGRKAKATEFVADSDLRALAGDLAGERGRLSAAATEAALTALGERRTAAAKAAKAAKVK
jgi:hypothetical protein